MIISDRYEFLSSTQLCKYLKVLTWHDIFYIVDIDEWWGALWISLANHMDWERSQGEAGVLRKGVGMIKVQRSVTILSIVTVLLVTLVLPGSVYPASLARCRHLGNRLDGNDDFL